METTSVPIRRRTWPHMEHHLAYRQPSGVRKLEQYSALHATAPVRLLMRMLASKRSTLAREGMCGAHFSV